MIDRPCLFPVDSPHASENKRALTVRDVVSLATAWSIECSGCCVICPLLAGQSPHPRHGGRRDRGVDSAVPPRAPADLLVRRSLLTRPHSQPDGDQPSAADARRARPGSPVAAADTARSTPGRVRRFPPANLRIVLPYAPLPAAERTPVPGATLRRR